MKTLAWLWVISLTMFLAPEARAQFDFTTNSGAITITSYTGAGGSVTIPGTINGYPVKSIGNSAFYNQSSVTNVILPSSLTNIDTQAFTWSGLTSVGIPNSVIRIAQSAFLYCTNLAAVSLGTGVMHIGDDAFYGCPRLTNVFIPSSATNIYSTAFSECTNLTNIDVDALNPVYSSAAGVWFNKNQTTLLGYPSGRWGNYAIPGSVNNIGDFAFDFCSGLTNVVLPGSVTNLGQHSFYGCNNVTNFTLPGSLISIGQYALASCSKLVTLTIPTNVTTIGTYALSSTALTNITLPASVTNLGMGAVGYCFSLRSINVAAGNPAYSSADGILFNSNQTTLVQYPLGKSGGIFNPISYDIPFGVTAIGDGAFQNSGVSNVNFSAGLTSIGRFAFGSCNYLTQIQIPNGVTNIGFGAFEATGITNLTIPSSVTTFEEFGYWPGLRSIYFEGNAPSPGTANYAWYLINGATVYHLPAATGWNATYFAVPTALWLPTLRSQGSGVAGPGTPFSFDINWARGQTVVVETCTNLSQPSWLPWRTNTLVTSTTNLTDLQSVNYPLRFYRTRVQ